MIFAGCRSRALAIAAMAAWVHCLAPTALRGQAPEQLAPGPELRALAARVGNWKYQGEAHTSPFGPAGNFEGEVENRMLLNGFFLESRWKDVTTPGYVAEGITLTGFDRKNKHYVEYAFENDGHAKASVLSIEGHTWSSTNDRVGHDGKTYKVRWSSTTSDDGNLDNAKAEYSADGRQTWQLYFELVAKRVIVNQ